MRDAVLSSLFSLPRRPAGKLRVPFLQIYYMMENFYRIMTNIMDSSSLPLIPVAVFTDRKQTISFNTVQSYFSLSAICIWTDPNCQQKERRGKLTYDTPLNDELFTRRSSENHVKLICVLTPLLLASSEKRSHTD